MTCTSKKLHGPTIRIDQAQWIVKEHAVVPLIDESTFRAAQRIMAEHLAKMPDTEMLHDSAVFF